MSTHAVPERTIEHLLPSNTELDRASHQLTMFRPAPPAVIFRRLADDKTRGAWKQKAAS
jgi:hypothetical protein